jgi:TIR domain/Thioredoxin
MAAKVFISYRRDDSAGHAGRVHDRLEKEFGRDLLFMDVDAIPLGADFVEVLTAEVSKCDVLLAIIGSGWLDARDAAGNRRLDCDQDVVWVEVATALKRGIPVVPILLDGTRVPSAGQLPDDLKGLVRRNGLDVRHASFHADMDKLVNAPRYAEDAQTNTSSPFIPIAGPMDTHSLSDAKHVSTANFVRDVVDESFSRTVVVFFWLKWVELGPEDIMMRTLQLRVLQSGYARFAKVKFDDHPIVAKALHVESAPTVVVFRDGRPIERFSGLVTESEILELVQPHS